MNAIRPSEMLRELMDKRAQYQRELHTRKMNHFHRLGALLIVDYDRSIWMRETIKLIFKWFAIHHPDADGKGCYIRRTIPMTGGRRISVWVDSDVGKNQEIAEEAARRFPYKVKTISRLPTMPLTEKLPRASRTLNMMRPGSTGQPAFGRNVGNNLLPTIHDNQGGSELPRASRALNMMRPAPTGQPAFGNVMDFGNNPMLPPSITRVEQEHIDHGNQGRSEFMAQDPECYAATQSIIEEDMHDHHNIDGLLNYMDGEDHDDFKQLVDHPILERERGLLEARRFLLDGAPDLDQNAVPMEVDVPVRAQHEMTPPRELAPQDTPMSFRMEVDPLLSDAEGPMEEEELIHVMEPVPNRRNVRYYQVGVYQRIGTLPVLEMPEH